MRNYKSVFLSLVLMTLCSSSPSLAVVKDVEGSQAEFEKSSQSIVRNKKFYRAGKLELGATFGIFPYDLAVDHKGFGGRLTWHLSDHFGWEIVDFQSMSGSTTTFVTSLVADAQKNIQDLQTVRLKSFIGTNLLISPFYAKIRFWGDTVLYFDIYLPVGVGFSSTETSKFNYSAGAPGGVASSVVASGSDLTLTMGVGFKLYMNNVMGVVVDLRNYMANSQAYGSKSFRSNFMASFGLAVFLPNF
jgi:outer membrane beta-barrel protein